MNVRVGCGCGCGCGCADTGQRLGRETARKLLSAEFWFASAQLAALAHRGRDLRLTSDEALAHPLISPTACQVITVLGNRHAEYTANRSEEQPRKKLQAEALRRVFGPPADRPSVEGLALTINKQR